jgi:hypothetical protein
LSDFGTQFKSFTETLGSAAKGVLSKIDQWSFQAVVNNLKDSDFEIAKDAIDELVKSQRPLAIPPLYFVSKMHPNVHIRPYAEKALRSFGKDKEIEQACAGKSPEEATKALIDLFGNYKR